MECSIPYKKFLASFSALLAWPWQSTICQQSQQILADFILAFLAFVGKKLYLPRIVGSTGGLLPSKIGRLGNLPNQSLLSIDFSTLLPRNLGKLGNI